MKEIFVVSGLPRSGTSMMMKMLGAGGLDVMTDAERAADDDNPRGYFELEAVKRMDNDESWLEGADGKVVKVISELLKNLPSGPHYKVIFMRRTLDEVLASQKKMLARRAEPEGDDDQIKALFVQHLEEVEELLRSREDMTVLFMNYNRMVADPTAGAERINKFVGGQLDATKMVAAVEPGLYRNRA